MSSWIRIISINGIKIISISIKIRVVSFIILVIRNGISSISFIRPTISVVNVSLVIEGVDSLES